MKDVLKRYAKRYDVIFSFGGMLLGSTIIYLKDWPVWAILAVVFFRELFGYMAMLSKENGQ